MSKLSLGVLSVWVSFTTKFSEELTCYLPLLTDWHISILFMKTSAWKKVFSSLKMLCRLKAYLKGMNPASPVFALSFLSSSSASTCLMQVSSSIIWLKCFIRKANFGDTWVSAATCFSSLAVGMFYVWISMWSIWLFLNFDLIVIS